MATYEYDPSKLKEYGKDMMRFQLGDTETDGKADTCALCDEEYEAILDAYPDSWNRAKLHCIESIFRRFSYEPNTTSGPVTLAFGERAKLWQAEYNRLKADVALEDVSADAIKEQGCPNPQHKDPYFYAGMMSHTDVEGRRRP